jgi:hypothetical protein
LLIPEKQAENSISSIADNNTIFVQVIILFMYPVELKLQLLT